MSIIIPETPEQFGIELPELAAAWTALENARNEIVSARDSLPSLIGLTSEEYNEYAPLYEKINNAERTISATQQSIKDMEYRRKGGLNGMFAWVIEGCRALDTDKGDKK